MKKRTLKAGCRLRGAWRDHCFPAPFSWFLHETGLECLKITSAGCFSLKYQRKDTKKAKEHRQFRGVLGRWRTAAIDRTTFHACLRCRKTAVFAVFSRLWVSLASIHLYFAGKQVGDTQKRGKPEMRSSCRTSLDLHWSASARPGRGPASVPHLRYLSVSRHFNE